MTNLSKPQIYKLSSTTKNTFNYSIRYEFLFSLKYIRAKSSDKMLLTKKFIVNKCLLQQKVRNKEQTKQISIPNLN